MELFMEARFSLTIQKHVSIINILNNEGHTTIHATIEGLINCYVVNAVWKS